MNKQIKIIFAIIIMLLIGGGIYFLIDEKKEIDYFISVFFTETPGWGTNYTESSLRVYDCRDLTDDYWMYPKDYDKVFNSAYEDCEKRFPSLFNRTKLKSNLIMRWANLSINSGSLGSSFIFSDNYTEPLIRISSKNSSSFGLEEPYFVTLRKDGCEQISCKQSNEEVYTLAYCYVCGEENE